MMPFDAYRCYLSLKNHFTKDHYDFHKYGGKTRATKQAFYKRKDRFWFEKVSRQKNDKEVVDFFVSNFVYTTDPSTMWIGEMIRKEKVGIRIGRRKYSHCPMFSDKKLIVYLKIRK